MLKENYNFVSIHGGHSGEFCYHAKNSLEEIICEYIKKKFVWVGITEHMPHINNNFLDPDQLEAGIDADFLFNQFVLYMKKIRVLQKKYLKQITIYAGVETETYTGYQKFIHNIRKKYKPDYIVGSLHHVNDMGFDYSKQQYLQVVSKFGGYDSIYCDYFDQQYEMIKTVKPEVVGHFDLIRIFDPDYHQRFTNPVIWEKICRNLKLIKKLNLILDFNLRALDKGASEPYLTMPILMKAFEMKISVIPGDDSHSKKDIGNHIKKGIQILQKVGFDTKFYIDLQMLINYD